MEWTGKEMKPLLFLLLCAFTGCAAYNGLFGFDPCQVWTDTTTGMPPGYTISYHEWPGCHSYAVLSWGQYDGQIYLTKEDAIRAAWDMYRNP